MPLCGFLHQSRHVKEEYSQLFMCICNRHLKNCHSVSSTFGSLVTKGRRCAKKGEFRQWKQMMHQASEPNVVMRIILMQKQLVFCDWLQLNLQKKCLVYCVLSFFLGPIRLCYVCFMHLGTFRNCKHSMSESATQAW